MHYNSAWTCDYHADVAQAPASSAEEGSMGEDVTQPGSEATPTTQKATATSVATQSCVTRSQDSYLASELCISGQKTEDSSSSQAPASAEADQTCGGKASR